MGGKGISNFISQGLIVLVSIVCVCHTAKVIQVTPILPPHPGSGKAIESNYTPRGTTYKIGNLSVYESQNRGAKRLLIAVHDLLGMSVNTKQVVDTLAELHNFRVVLPDFYHGHQWVGPIPPENPEDLDYWMENYGNWNKTVRDDIYTVITAFREIANITEVGMYGMCWGGIVSVLTASEIEEVKATAFVHPTYVTNELAEDVKRPMYLMPAQNDPDLLPFYEVMKRKFGNNTGHRRFDDMRHGFAGAGGNFSDPLVVQRVEEVIDILGGFFNYNLKNGA